MTVRSPRSLNVLTGLLASLALGCAVSAPLNFDADSNASDAASASAHVGGATGGTSGPGGSAGTSAHAGSGGHGGSGGNLGAAGAAGSAGHGGGAGTSGGSSGSAGHAGAAGTTGRGGGAGTGVAGSKAIRFDASTAPTFTEIYKSILSVDCGGSTCHYPGTQHGLGFSTQSGAYKSLVSVAVIPGNAQGSTLYTDLATGTMPDGKPMLSSTLIDQVAAWIDDGALNN